jgi:hypothetical protein
MNRMEVREKAIDEAKKGGDPHAAIALALVYVGDAIDYADSSPDIYQVAEALRTVAAELGGRS